MNPISFKGIYRLDGLTTYKNDVEKPVIKTSKIPNRFHLSETDKLKSALGQWDTPKLKASREYECLEDFISNRPRHKLGQTALFWANKKPYAVTNDEKGQDFKTYKAIIRKLVRQADKAFNALPTSDDSALSLIKRMTAQEVAKHPYHTELTEKATPATVEITRGGTDGFIVNYAFKPQS